MNTLARFFEARRRRLAVRDLRALPPNILLDIGIEPGRIDSVVAEAMDSQREAKPTRQCTPRFAAPGLSRNAWPYPWRRTG